MRKKVEYNFVMKTMESKKKSLLKPCITKKVVLIIKEKRRKQEIREAK